MYLPINCKVVLKYEKVNGTSTLKRHLDRCSAQAKSGSQIALSDLTCVRKVNRMQGHTAAEVKSTVPCALPVILVDTYMRQHTLQALFTYWTATVIRQNFIPSQVPISAMGCGYGDGLRFAYIKFL